MGPKNFTVIISKYAPTAITYAPIQHYAYSVIGIDANLLMYKMIYAIRRNGYDILNGETAITHIHSLLSKFRRFIEYNITPVFVFDGMPPVLKHAELDKRHSFQESMRKRYEEPQTPAEKKKYYFMKSDISVQEITDCMNLISIFGWTVIEAIEEADSQLAQMSQSGQIDYVASDDLDILIFGGKKLLKNFTVDKKKTIQEIDLDVLKTTTGLSDKQLIDLVILLGCDYCKGVKGIGPISAYNLIKKVGSIEVLVQQKLLKEAPHNYAKTQKNYLKPLVMSAKSIEISPFNLNKDKLRTFLLSFDYSADQITKIIDHIESKASRV